MRPRTQSLLIGGLIILLVCQPMIKPITNYLMLPFGRILAFGLSVYVGATVSPVIGLLLALVCLQAMSDFYIVEHMKGNATTGAQCRCPPGFIQEGMNCKSEDGKKTTKPTACTCPSPGYAYDVVTGLCEQNSVITSPIPVTEAAPEGAIEVAPPPAPSPPAASSVRGKRIELPEPPAE